MIYQRDTENTEVARRKNKFMNVPVLFLSLIVVCLTANSPITVKSHNELHVDRPIIKSDRSKTLNCDPKDYSVEEGTEPGTNSVKIVRDGTVLHTVRLPTQVEVNGFGFDGVKKTKAGFEIAIEYGSVIFYAKRFIFVCRQHKFYLTQIKVDSFNRHNPENWTMKVIRVRPNLPLEKFSVDDFMLEGVVKDKKPD
jgi:hypothetical protein